jgi:tetratricopeptide (TPR) repeat protein
MLLTLALLASDAALRAPAPRPLATALSWLRVARSAIEDRAERAAVNLRVELLGRLRDRVSAGGPTAGAPVPFDQLLAANAVSAAHPGEEAYLRSVAVGDDQRSWGLAMDRASAGDALTRTAWLVVAATAAMRLADVPGATAVASALLRHLEEASQHDPGLVGWASGVLSAAARVGVEAPPPPSATPLERWILSGPLKPASLRALLLESPALFARALPLLLSRLPSELILPPLRPLLVESKLAPAAADLILFKEAYAGNAGRACAAWQGDIERLGPVGIWAAWLSAERTQQLPAFAARLAEVPLLPRRVTDHAVAAAAEAYAWTGEFERAERTAQQIREVAWRTDVLVRHREMAGGDKRPAAAVASTGRLPLPRGDAAVRGAPTPTEPQRTPSGSQVAVETGLTPLPPNIERAGDPRATFEAAAARGDHAAAARYGLFAIDMAPRDAELRLSVALHLRSLGRWAEAVQQMETAARQLVDRRRRAALYRDIAQLHDDRLASPRSALESFLVSYLLNPEDAVTFSGLERNCRILHRYKDLVTAFESAVEVVDRGVVLGVPGSELLLRRALIEAEHLRQRDRAVANAIRGLERGDLTAAAVRDAERLQQILGEAPPSLLQAIRAARVRLAST